MISVQHDLITQRHKLNKQAGRRVQLKSESHLLRGWCVRVAEKLIQGLGEGETFTCEPKPKLKQGQDSCDIS